MSNECTSKKNYLDMNGLQKKLGNRSRTAIYQDFANGRLPRGVRLGGKRYWLESEVDDCLQKLAEAQAY